ncbi:Rv1733c family protein [Streptomyces sp. YIM S03343]
MRTRVRGWRWRRNPLRRRSDVIEAWTALAVAVLLFVGAPLAGALAGMWAHRTAQALVDAQRADRHRVNAQVIGRPPVQHVSARSGTVPDFRVTVRWTEPGQGTRTAVADVPGDSKQGDIVPVWFDSQGRSVAPPQNATSVWQHTVGVGTVAAVGAATAVLIVHGTVRHVALRHRMAEWERDWARTGPDWTRRRA